MGQAIRGLTGDGRRTSWVLTDGKAGDEAQCLGLAEALDLSPNIRIVRPRSIFALAMPWGPIDPREAPDRPGSPIAPPFPDILIASGRRAVPYLRAVRRASGGDTFTVFLKDPRVDPGVADLVWVQEHDRLRGPNVLTTLLAPHRVSPARIAAARTALDPRIANLPRPRVAVLVGGDSRHHRFASSDVDRLIEDLIRLASDGASLAVTTSRRTPPGLADRLRGLASPPGHFFWGPGEPGDNPYLSLLAGADAIVVTADSSNMVGEATATGVPVLVFEPSGGHPKFTQLIQALTECGAVRSFAGRLVEYAYQPLDSSPEIAQAVRDAYVRHAARRDRRAES